ncbi:MAG: hypothetical protein RLZZ426_35 [Actinomycetota bacterium]
MKSVFKLAATVILIGSVAACGLIDRAGAAAVIGENSMSTDQVIAEYNSVMAALGDQAVPGTPIEINRALLSSYVVATLVDDIILKAGIEIDPAELKVVRAQLIADLGSEEALIAAAASGAVAPQNIDRTLLTTIKFNAIGRYLDPNGTETTQSDASLAAIVEYAKIVGVEVAPRFGTWSNESLSIAGDSNDVSITADALAALTGQLAQ